MYLIFINIDAPSLFLSFHLPVPQTIMFPCKIQECHFLCPTYIGIEYYSHMNQKSFLKNLVKYSTKISVQSYCRSYNSLCIFDMLTFLRSAFFHKFQLLTRIPAISHAVYKHRWLNINSIVIYI